MQEGFQRAQFPGADIGLGVDEYAKIMCSFLDIPIHKTNNNKSVVEALHVMFTLYNEFKQNQHFQQQQDNNDINDGQVDYFKVNHE